MVSKRGKELFLKLYSNWFFGDNFFKLMKWLKDSKSTCDKILGLLNKTELAQANFKGIKQKYAELVFRKIFKTQSSPSDAANPDSDGAGQSKA